MRLRKPKKSEGSKPKRRSLWSLLFRGRRSAQRREVVSKRISIIHPSDRDPISSSHTAVNYSQDFTTRERRHSVMYGGMLFQQSAMEPIRIPASADLELEEVRENVGAQTWTHSISDDGDGMSSPLDKRSFHSPPAWDTLSSGNSSSANPPPQAWPSTWEERAERYLGPPLPPKPMDYVVNQEMPTIRLPTSQPGPDLRHEGTSEGRLFDLGRLSLGWTSRRGSSRASTEVNDSSSDIGNQSDFDQLSFDDISDAGEDILGTSFGSEEFSYSQDSMLAVLAIDHNMRYLNTANPPSWYILNPPIHEPEDPAYLCGTCRRIDFATLLSQEEVTETPRKDAMIRLGSLREMFSKFFKCGFCRLVMRILCLETGRKALPPNSTIQEMADYFLNEYIQYNSTEVFYLYPCRFQSLYNDRILYLGRGDRRRDSLIDSTSFFRPDPSLAMRQVHECCQAPNMGRLIDEEHLDTINYRWIREQMALCNERDVGAPNYLPIDIEVIDVQHMCLVTRPFAADFVTLSYVWGDAKNFEHNDDTAELLHVVGGLELYMVWIPQTIKDAITLTHEIGERYLWVDALCIKQDDDKEKPRQLAHMGQIYQSSVLTIIARSGKDASDGLRGVIPGTRRVRQVTARVGNTIMSNVLPLQTDLPSIWKTRAWTMQEDSLARRRLYISEDGCYFWCWHSTTPEDAFCRHKGWRVGQSHSSMALFYQGHHDAIVQRHQDSMLDIYAWVVAQYTTRDLTKPEDAENALMGILSVVQQLLVTGFVAALPRSHLNSALLWYPIGSSHRRTSKETKKPLFPSWSWLGWCGQAAYPWIVERSYELARLDDIWGANMDVVYTRYPRTDDTQNPGQLKLHVFSASLALSGVPLRRAENYNFEHQLYYQHVLDDQGFCVGCIFIPDPACFTDEQEEDFLQKGTRFEFIALSRASAHSGSSTDQEQISSMEYLTEDLRRRAYTQTFHSHFNWESPTRLAYDRSYVHKLGNFNTQLYDEEIPYCLVNVMMIKWNERYKTATRVAVGRIHIDAFCQAGAIEKDVVLE